MTAGVIAYVRSPQNWNFSEKFSGTAVILTVTSQPIVGFTRR